ncbi:MAG: hypothetical protein HOC20_08390 [Chloroflexi bacterium]|jgi:hypothetical protein|nr:hypothetical protein [Chloroflexota bacterium]
MTPDRNTDIANTMRNWQKIENASIASTGQIIEKTGNPLIRLVAEIIQRDSLMHHRVQEFIADSLEHKAVSLNPEELVEVWGLIEHHIKIENQTMELAQKMLDSTKNQQGLLVQDYLISYLMQDEQKHNDLLSRLDEVKRGIYRSV